MKMANLDMGFKEIDSVSTDVFTKVIKNKIKATSFKHLKEMQSTHSKIKYIDMIYSNARRRSIVLFLQPMM